MEEGRIPLSALLENPEAIAALPMSLKLALAASLHEAIGGERSQEKESSAAKDGAGHELLTINEAAALLRVTPRWLYRHARKLPFTRKLSRKVLRFSRVGLERWLERQKT
jgi:excisionase family DNA binding protein